MKTLQESILSTTKSGIKEYLAKQVEDLLHVKRDADFIIDDSNKIDIWNVPSNTVIELSKWPEELQFWSFDTYKQGIDIVINSQKDYEKFLKCFDCNIGRIGNVSSAKSKSEFLPTITFKNCKVDSSQLTYHYYCNMKFNKCQVDISKGINAFNIEIDNCDVEMPYNFSILKQLKIK